METSTSDDTLIAALWRVIAAHGWPGLTMRRLAAEAGTDTATLRERFPTRLDLLLLHGRVMDQAVLAGTIPGQGGTERDRVFDVLMRRLDAMQPHREGILPCAGCWKPLRLKRKAAKRGCWLWALPAFGWRPFVLGRVMTARIWAPPWLRWIQRLTGRNGSPARLGCCGVKLRRRRPRKQPKLRDLGREGL
jgi:AcrR family transcriptional regulator